jgi:HK97 family phage major capsid protein
MPNYTVKAITGNRFGGYTAVWGNPKQLDLQGDYFIRETDFALEAFQQRPLIHHHGQTDAMGRTIIGTIDTWKKDNVGLWCEGEFKRLDDDIDLFDEEERKLRAEYIEIIKEKIARGELNFSSGALGHLVKRLDDGKITEWFWAESSTTGSPAEPRRTEIELIKSIKGMETFLAEGETPAKNIQTKTEVVPINTQEITSPSEAPGDAVDTINNTTENLDEGVRAMTPEELLAMIAEQEFAPEDVRELIARLTEMAEAEMAALDETAAAEKQNGDDEEDDEEPKNTELPLEQQLEKAVQSKSFRKSVFEMVKDYQSNLDKVKDHFEELKNAKPPRGTGGQRVPGTKAKTETTITMKSKYERAGWEAEDYAYFMYAMQANNSAWQPSIELLRESASKMVEEANEIGLTAKAFGQAQRVSAATKANEVENTGQTGYGAEWVAEGWSNNIIQKARVDNVVLPLMTVVEMPTEPYNMPIESTDPTVYAVGETTDQSQLTHTSGNAATMSKIGTDKIQLSSGQLVVWIAISEFEEEDALVPVLPQKRKQSQRAIADAMDNVILNADQAATGNINYNGGTLAATSKWRYGGDGGVGGLAYVPLKTTTTNLANMGGSPTWAQMRDLRRLLAKAYSIKQNELAYIVDVDTWHALSLMEGVVLVSDYGNDATIRTGEVGRIGLVPVFASEQLELADDTGFVSSTAGNNKYGRAILMHRPTQYLGYRRRPKIDNFFDPIQGAHEIRVSVRMATQRFDADSVAMLKNITV